MDLFTYFSSKMLGKGWEWLEWFSRVVWGRRKEFTRFGWIVLMLGVCVFRKLGSVSEGFGRGIIFF